MRKLTKKYMSEKYQKYDKSIYEDKTRFTEFLKQVKEEFYNHKFKLDKRYVFTGRHKFLIEEMEQLYFSKHDLEEHHYDKCPTVWCLDSVLEMIFNPNFLSIADYENLVNKNKVYQNKSVNECRTIHLSYEKDDVISLEERDYILHGINMIEDSLRKCNESLEWNEQNTREI